MKAVIIIPARWDSERLPNKPFVKIKGKEMLLRVIEIAQFVKDSRPEIKDVYVATNDERIIDFCTHENTNSVFVPEYCRCGTDRVAFAVDRLKLDIDFVINYQGDNPLCPPWFLENILDEYIKDNSLEVISPMVNLTWNELDKLRDLKQTSPFSGTTTVFDKNHDAIWFTKQILPAIRREGVLRSHLLKSPVYKHIGIYGYSVNTLKKVLSFTASDYMDMEGLEQFLFLDNGVKIRLCEVDYKNRGESMPGINTIDLVEMAERIIETYGELLS